MKRMMTVFAVLALAGCGAFGEFMPAFSPASAPMSAAPSNGLQASGKDAPGLRPEQLVACRGHVIVPAMGMTFVPAGAAAPSSGQYIREESLTPPYRVLPPGAMATMDYNPNRLNVELDQAGRIVNLRCG